MRQTLFGASQHLLTCSCLTRQAGSKTADLAEQVAAGTREIKADEPALLQLRTQLEELGSERSTLQATSATSRQHLGGISA